MVSWSADPWLLLRDDIWFFITNPHLILRFAGNGVGWNSTNPQSELYYGISKGVRAPLRNLLAFLYQLVLFLITPVVGLIYIPISLLGIHPSIYHTRAAETIANERWYFINGVAVNQWWLQQNCNFLDSRFGRRITGIPNVSFGIFWDLCECILQRSFRMATDSVRCATDELFTAATNPAIHVIYLISHSQGTIIANLSIQQLFVRLSEQHPPADVLAMLGKFRVITFACASRCFLNPNGAIPRIEHYCNEEDPVAMLGILRPGNNPYHGNVFISPKRKGHLLAAYYSMDATDYVDANRGGAVPDFLNNSLFPLPHNFPAPIDF